MRKVILILFLSILTACSSSRAQRGGSSFASGVIANACLAADRNAANRQLCGCIQQVANQSLSARDQDRAADFFANPQKAQDTRQSDSGPSERFWLRYKDFSAAARQQCG